MSIKEEIEKVRSYGEPANEAETCHWVIVPLLEASGYARNEIRTQNADGAGRYPDYTILPNAPEKWFLEAKAWRETLRDEHVHQAVYSAYSTGQRWVVLSNGREWRLYDATTRGSKPGDRLVSVAFLTDTVGLEELLVAIGRESMISKSIEGFAAEAKLRMVLDDQFSNPASPLLKRIAEILRRDFQVPSATPGAVQAFLRGSRTSGLPGERVTTIAPAPPGQRVPQLKSHPVKVQEGRADYANDRLHILTPVRDEIDWKVTQQLPRLLQSGWYVFGATTPYRAKLKAGDKILFFHTGVGVVAEAEIDSSAELGEVPGVSAHKKFGYRFRVKSPRIFTDRPVRINDPALRAKLEAFRGREDMGNWSWFVQGTGRVSAHDYEILAGRS